MEPPTSLCEEPQRPNIAGPGHRDIDMAGIWCVQLCLGLNRQSCRPTANSGLLEMWTLDRRMVGLPVDLLQHQVAYWG